MPVFLDYLCNYCCEEEHDICWDLKPDPDCVCCAETARLQTARLLATELTTRLLGFEEE